MIAKIFIKKELYKSYLNYLFAKDVNGNFIVTRNSDFGKFLTSIVRYSKTPVTAVKLQPDTKLTSFMILVTAPDVEFLNFLLPASRPLANAEYYYLYYSAEDQEKINDYLEVFFNIDFDRFYLNGRKMDLQQQTIIQDFILTRKLVQLIGDNETLKKREYRDELKLLKKYCEMLITRAYDRNIRGHQAVNVTNRLTAK